MNIPRLVGMLLALISILILKLPRIQLQIGEPGWRDYRVVKRVADCDSMNARLSRELP